MEFEFETFNFDLQELLKAFSSEETSMCRLFAVINDNPTRSIYNALLTSAITYILYSSTGEQRPLIDYLFKVT